MGNRETGRVIKAAAVRANGSRIAFDFEDVQKHCDEQLDVAQARAREVVEDARREAETIRAAAQAEARAEGKAAGLADAETEIARRVDAMARAKAAEQLGTLAPAVQRAAESLAAERDRWIAEWERRVVDLAVAIAGRIVRTEIASRPEVVREVVVDVLRLVAGEEEVTLRMNPADEAVLGDNADDLVSRLTTCARGRIVGDESVERGGCVVRTRHGEIDARVESQLGRIAAELRGGDPVPPNEETPS